jgi:hypothetical protein
MLPVYLELPTDLIPSHVSLHFVYSTEANFIETSFLVLSVLVLRFALSLSNS